MAYGFNDSKSKVEVVDKTEFEEYKNNGSASLDKIYPVGSIYMNVSEVDPGSLFGGTWERLVSGKMLINEGDGFTAGATGGSKEHTLTVDEMPSHGHNVTVDKKSLVGTVNDKSNTSAMPFKGEFQVSGIISKISANSNYVNFYSSKNTAYGLKIDASHDHTASADETGGGQAFSTISPYLVVYMWKRTA